MRPSMLHNAVKALLSAILMSSCTGPATPARDRADLTLTKCILTARGSEPQVDAKCGTLTVPEDPSSPGSRPIELSLAVVEATRRNAEPDPLFILVGGPGQSASETFAAIYPAFFRIHQDRDIVLVDQRGTGKSNPLRCLDPRTRTLAEEETLPFLKEWPKKLEAGLRFYTTDIAMQDLDRVRRILKSLIKIYQGPDNRYLNFFGPSYTISTIPFYEALQFSKSNGNAESMYPSCHDKVVFIGASGSLTVAQKDSFYTVFSEPNGLDLCGVEIAATAFANLLEDMPIQPLRFYAYFTVIFLWGLALGIFCLRLPSLISAGSVVGISALYLIIALHQFKNTGAWYPLIIPLFFQAPLAFFSALVCRYIETHKERKNIRTAFKYYIPDEIVDQLTKNIEGLKTHGQVVYGTCLSTDAEQYTSLSEAMSPGELGCFMNKYYEKIFEPIRQHGGMITNVA